MSVRASGTIARLYVRQDVTYVQLDIDAATAPKDGYFTLEQRHPNYNAQYSLLLAAAANRWTVTIRVVGDDISPANESKINYLTVDWD